MSCMLDAQHADCWPVFHAMGEVCNFLILDIQREFSGHKHFNAIKVNQYGKLNTWSALCACISSYKKMYVKLFYF